MNAAELVQEDVMSAMEEETEEQLERGKETALYHHRYRKELLAQAVKAVGATYDYEPLYGLTPLDVTAVHENQISWGKDGKHRPIELHLFNPPTAENLPRKAIGHLKYDGKLLLDFNGKRLRDFPSLPLIISSTVEGWRVEAWMRSDSRMKTRDIIARIPVKWATDSAGHQISVPMFEPSTVRERARRFRNDAGLISWKPQGNDPKIKSFMDELRSPGEKANNQTRGYDLTDLEKSSLRLLNVGTRPDRAQVSQHPEAKQKYLNRVQKKADLTFDFDCRAERPVTPEEIREIQKALEHTCSDFALYTNVPLEMPNTQDSYLDQWNCMQVQLNRIWANDRTNKTEPPQLFALGKWTASFNDWASAPQAYLTYLRK